MTSKRDDLDRLCHELYGRPPRARDYLGGSNANVLADAADEIRRLRDALPEPDKLEKLAKLFDAVDADLSMTDDRSVQEDLRKWARLARAGGGKRPDVQGEDNA